MEVVRKTRKGNFKGLYPVEYRSWKAMKARCYAPCHKDSKYQLNGIQVCKEWKESFPTFLQDMGMRPTPTHSLDRRDNLGPYSPTNCRWATPLEQSSNRGEFNIEVTYKGRTQTLKAWCLELEVPYDRTQGRMQDYAYLSFEDAIQDDPFGYLIEYQGKSQTLPQWSKELGIPLRVLYDRHHQQWETTRMFEQPVRKSPTKKTLTQ